MFNLSKLWGSLHSPPVSNFNCTEFDTIRNAAGSNNFVFSPPPK